MQAARIQTARLELEPITQAHAQEAWPLVDDDRMWRFFPAKRPQTPQALRDLYGKWERGSGKQDEIWCNWHCRERTSRMIAGSMQSTIFAYDRLAYVAYAIYPQFQRKGFAREATRAVMNYVREHYGVRRFYAEMDTRNQASYRLAESLGFKRIETRLDEYLYELRL